MQGQGVRLVRLQRLFQGAALFIVGAITGAAVYHGIFLHQIDELIMRNLDLQDRLAHYKAEAEALLKYKNRSTVIKSITMHIYESAEEKMSPSDETELRKRLLKDLDGLKGRNVYQIDEYVKLIEGLLTRKLYTNVHHQNYVVTLRTMLVTEGVLHVWVDVKAELPSPG
ncbi:hypothetical protein FPZ44_04150 [Paenibacillus agilis]|uniref:Sporulation membrane protein YtrI C-terminal domain-containing protein n=1 Tax=Paenibacillus agilis TaxID=3020863 RepID=A0A559J3V7_9BACL|nr:hypothetical protein FPZ44_04150 [Paenibacillus agilis]